jgi:hypothetical protein
MECFKIGMKQLILNCGANLDNHHYPYVDYHSWVTHVPVPVAYLVPVGGGSYQVVSVSRGGGGLTTGTYVEPTLCRVLPKFLWILVVKVLGARANTGSSFTHTIPVVAKYSGDCKNRSHAGQVCHTLHTGMHWCNNWYGTVPVRYLPGTVPC